MSTKSQKATTASARRRKPEAKKANGDTPGIKEKDQKLLWSRSAGRCAICRVELTLDAAEEGAVTLGAMCHIVGEREKAARGISPLPIADRNSYANLILLCSHHHDLIDRNSKKYPVEVLHDTKTKHELWVSESLSARTLDPDMTVYADWVDTLTTALQLDHWEWFIDHAVRDLVHDDFFRAQTVLNAKLLAAVFPRKFPALNAAIRRVVTAFNSYMEQYSSGSEARPGEFHGPDVSYARFWNPQYAEFVEREEVWSDESFWMLLDYVVALNEYVTAVRKCVNAMYFRTRGTFIVHDTLGVRSGMRYMLYRPTSAVVEKAKQHAMARRKRFEEAKRAGDFPVVAARPARVARSR